MKILQENFIGESVDSNHVPFEITLTNEKIKYILDPHTAVAFRARLSKKNKSRLDNTVVLGTAHPYKFLETVEPNLYYKKSIPVPKQFSDIMDKKEKFDIIGNTITEVKNYILGKIQ